MDKPKKCFIITPIGTENSDIRRHIDGVIDAAMLPVLEELQYKIEVAHRIDVPGNIPKQVIIEIFESDLTITNLTNNNPNVMYELALRHCFGKPNIIIAEKGTLLPADIIGERTIFYINDAQGVIDLRSKLSDMITNIEKDENKDKIGPVYEALEANLKESSIISAVTTGEGQDEADAFKYLINRIDELQKDIRKNRVIERRMMPRGDGSYAMIMKLDETAEVGLRKRITEYLRKIPEIISVDFLPQSLRLEISKDARFKDEEIVEIVADMLREEGINIMDIRIRT